MRLIFAALVVATLVPVPALAYHDDETSHACPLPPTKAQRHFARNFHPSIDRETTTKAFKKECSPKSWRVAGFGGRRFRPEPGAKRIRGRHCRGSGKRPVIFVHGNNVDAADWYPVLPVFAQAGFTMCRLWGLGYNGVGGNNGEALYTRNERGHAERGDAGNTTRITNDTLNLPDVEDFIRAVLRYTGARRFSVVSHSLGVTLARKVLKDNPDLLARLDRFVGIAGGNHGTTFCQGQQPILAGDPGHALVSCDELAPDMEPIWTNQWLADLNAGDETPGRAGYMTIYDGSGFGDPAYYGQDAQSPHLEGATNCTFPGAYHNDLRVDPSIASVYVAFIAHRKLPTVGPGESTAAPNGGTCKRIFEN